MTDRQAFRCFKKTRLKITKLGFTFTEEIYNENDEKIDINPFPDKAGVIMQRKKGEKKPKRGKCVQFTPGSKKRMMDKIIDIEDLPDSFLTLTFPKDAPYSEEAKKILNVFLEYYTRQGMTFVWKQEPQKRGAPHFHILCYYETDTFRETVCKRWIKKMTAFNKLQKRKSKVADIKKYGAILEPLNADEKDAHKKTFLYVTKYSSKTYSSFLNPDGSIYNPASYGDVVYDVKANGERYGFVIGDEVVDPRTGEVVGAPPIVAGRQWGCVGLDRKVADDKSVIIHGSPLSKYLEEVHGCNPERMRKYHIFLPNELPLLMAYLEEYSLLHAQNEDYVYVY